MERGLHADLPVTDRGGGADAGAADVPRADRGGAGPGRSTPSGPRRAPPSAAADGRRARRSMTRRPTRRPAGRRRLRVGLAGLGSMGRNHLRILVAPTGRPARRPSPIPSPTSLAAAADQSGAQAFAEPLAMIAEAELDALVIAAPTTAHVPLAARRDRARRRRSSSRSRSRRRSTRRCRSSPRPRERGVPVQVGHVERFNPAVLELGRLLGDGWLSSRLRDRLAGARARSRPGSATSA